MAERRTHDRVPIQVRIVYDRAEQYFAEYSADISQGGMFIRTPTPLEVGTVFSLVCKLPDVQEAFLLEAKVEWTRADEEEETGMGVRFLFVDEGEKQAVDEALAGMSTT